MNTNISFEVMNEKNVFSGVNTTSQSAANPIASIKGVWMAFLTAIAALYSTMLEEEVSVARAKQLLNAQAAFLALIICSCGPILLTFLAIAWLYTAIRSCRRK